MPLLGHTPADAIHGMYMCALRFDGYKYEQEILHESSCIGLQKLAEPFRESLILDRDLTVNFALFFVTQRRLNEDDMLRDSRDHLLFDMLFLHLYQAEIPSRYRNEDFCRLWDKYTQEQVDIMAGLIRESFGSIQRIVPKDY
jgi:hypothetical protein